MYIIRSYTRFIWKFLTTLKNLILEKTTLWRIFVKKESVYKRMVFFSRKTVGFFELREQCNPGEFGAFALSRAMD